MPPVETTRYHCQIDGSDSQREVTVRRVINATARHYGLTAADLVGSSRCRQVSQARGLAMYLARRLTSRSLQSIGDAFGGRDHTTVMSAVRKIEAQREIDPQVRAHIEALERKLAENS
jgi:chromosomal replication initiator protein